MREIKKKLFVTHDENRKKKLFVTHEETQKLFVTHEGKKNYL